HRRDAYLCPSTSARAPSSPRVSAWHIPPVAPVAGDRPGAPERPGRDHPPKQGVLRHSMPILLGFLRDGPVSVRLRGRGVHGAHLLAPVLSLCSHTLCAHTASTLPCQASRCLDPSQGRTSAVAALWRHSHCATLCWL